MRRASRTLATTAVIAGTATAIVLACGPFFQTLETVHTSEPVDRVAYDRGDLGVVRPSFSRRYLIQAYRTLNGAPQAPLDQPQSAPNRTPAQERWQTARAQVFPRYPRAIIEAERRLKNYQSFTNCTESSFESAITILDARIRLYGGITQQVTSWASAQDEVFRNCGGDGLTLPPPAPQSADPQLQADREYQTAAAYFYAMQYDEAARRFRAIAADRSSSWRPYGRYMAGRALIRFATVPDDGGSLEDRLDLAERELRATLADADASFLHTSARRLLDFIAARRRPVEQLHALSTRVGSTPAPAAQDVTDYTWLLNSIELRPIVSNDPSTRIAPDVLASNDEMTTWILAMREGEDRAIVRWLESPSDVWLVAALWTSNTDHQAVPRLLEAAARVPNASPAYSTITFLRARMLVKRNELDEARRLLATLPSSPTPGFTPETLNLLDAARFASAENLEALLRVAPRRLVSLSADSENLRNLTSAPRTVAAFTNPVWDDDVAAVLSSRLPLDLLVQAAESNTLPDRLRLRVAQAAFTRALVLERAEYGRRAAAVLQRLAPSMRSDIGRYLAATTDATRKRAAVILLLRTPGLSINIGGTDTDQSQDATALARRFGHAFAGNWWCRIVDARANNGAGVIYGTGNEVPFPTFVAEAERETVARELASLTALGEPRAYLMSASIDWARERRADPLAAEALALSIEGWRWSACNYGMKSPLPSRAFALLHRQFPTSEWAKHTRYWYE